MTTAAPTADLQSVTRHFEELDDQGYTILYDLLAPDQCARAIAALQEIFEREKDVAECHEPGTLRSMNLTARNAIFRELIQLPKVVACMEHLLGDDYILADMGTRAALPGCGEQALHRDGGTFIPNPPYNVHKVVPLFAQSIFALVDFTEDNGATRFVPASHRIEMDPKTVRPEDERLFIAPAGTVLIYDSRLLHGGAANRSDTIRYALHGFCCRSYVKPFCDHTRSIPRHLVESATPLMRRLWGFESQSSWEDADRPRRFRYIKAPGARPIFNYNAGIPDAD